MSFNLFRTTQTTPIDIKIDIKVNVKIKYKQIADEFCRQYYSVYDENFSNLVDLYYTDSQFTYLDQEFIGFNNLLQKIKSFGINKFVHNNLNITAQPIGNNYIIISIVGQIIINNSVFPNKFMETIYVQITDENKFKVCSTIFKLLD